MKPHTKTYISAMGFHEADFIPCELCGGEAVDIHHLDSRGMGGTSNPFKNSIFNLMALCRFCHEKYGDIVSEKPRLKKIHFFKVLHRMQSWLNVYKEIDFKEDESILMK